MGEEPRNNPRQAMQLFPILVWSEIFEKSTPKTVLNCRQVCEEFKEAVDRMIKLIKPSELDPLPLDENPIRKFCATKIFNRQSMTKFQEEMKNHEVNPFPTRILSFHPKRCDCRDFCDGCLLDFKRAYDKFSEFSQRFGKEVHNMQFTVVNQLSMEHLQKSLFHNFSNLRQLEIKVVKAGRASAPVLWRANAPDFKWLKNYNFPKLEHLTNLKLTLSLNIKNSELLITQVLKAYGSQIKSLTVSMVDCNVYESYADYTPIIEDLPSEDLPNLINLKVRMIPGLNEQHVLKLLINGNWPLKQLSIGDNDYSLRDFVGIISKFASTLEILHLYSSYGEFVTQLKRMSVPGQFTPEEVATELQLNIKLPRVREFSLPYRCITHGGLATSKLCEKFENLKTLHLLDDRLKNPLRFGYGDLPKYEQELNKMWWPVLSPTSKLKRVIVYFGNQFDDDVVVHQVIMKPDI